ncbi:MAG TPA: TonB-dependent receptor [Gemmatimonadaceae bacterium]|nr:TonB-dependent receptor [Gemmatimonadaceae bacterium]
MTGIALLLSLVHALLGASLEGSVRSSDGSAPVVGAYVELTAATSHDLVARAFTDSAGRYLLPDLESGTYHLRVSRIGFDPRELDVLVYAAPRVVVDVLLEPRPQLLSELRVRATEFSGTGMRQYLGARPEPESATMISGEQLHSDPALGSPDALQSLLSRGLAFGREEAPTSLHVHGGAGAENVVYVDGVPVFNAYHATGTLTALDPDVISSVSLDRGAPGAMFGDATGAMISLSTTAADTTRVTTHGGFSGRAVRESVGGPLARSGGTFLVAFRRSLDASLSDSPSRSVNEARFGDLFARVTMPVRSGELELFALHADDRLSFDGAPEQTAVAAAVGDRRDDERVGETRAIQHLPTNRLGWNTGTGAVTWRSGAPGHWMLSAWHTQFDARFAWTGTTRLASSLSSTGGTASASYSLGGLRLDGGVDASELDVHYDVASLLTSNPILNGQTPLILGASSPLVTTFGEAQLSIGARWSAAAGLRSTLVAPVQAGVEPRFSLRFAPTSSLAFGVGYARTHQFVQSLRNEESLIDAVAGISLPALAGSHYGSLEVPAAKSDQLIATADARLSSSLSVSATAYARRETGAVLVAPTTSQPFALTGFAVGVVRASGVSLSLTREGERVSGELGYSLGSVIDRGNGISYSPSYDAAQAISGALGLRVATATTLRIAASAHSGTPTSVIADPVEWMPYTSSAGRGDLAGSPQHIVGALDGSRLPAYFRIDLGIRREWRVRAFGRESSLSTSAGVTNLFGRINALGVMAPATSAPATLLLMPRRSATFGLEWTY